MQVELIYHKDAGTVLSALTRVSDPGSDDTGDVRVLTLGPLKLRGPGTPEIMEVSPSTLDRFTVEADDQLEQLIANPWAFGVENKALVTHDKTLTLNWNTDKFEATLAPKPLAGAEIVFLICRESGAGGLITDMVTRVADGSTSDFGTDAFGDPSTIKWALILAAGYQTRAQLAQ